LERHERHKMSKKKKVTRAVRKFTLEPEVGAAAFLAGSTAECLPLKSMSRKGNKVVAVYEK